MLPTDQPEQGQALVDRSNGTPTTTDSATTCMQATQPPTTAEEGANMLLWLASVCEVQRQMPTTPKVAPQPTTPRAPTMLIPLQLQLPMQMQVPVQMQFPMAMQMPIFHVPESFSLGMLPLPQTTAGLLTASTEDASRRSSVSSQPGTPTLTLSASAAAQRRALRLRRLLVCCDSCTARAMIKYSPDNISYHRDLDPANIDPTRLCDLCGGELAAPISPIERRFHCYRCNQTFTRGDRLLAHSHKHTKVKPFHCTQCPRTFSRRPRLMGHYQKFHSSRPLAHADATAQPMNAEGVQANVEPLPVGDDNSSDDADD